MRLIDNWRKTLRKSWSMRFMLVSSALTGAELAVPTFSDSFPPKVFAALAIATTLAAAVARLIYQQKLNEK